MSAIIKKEVIGGQTLILGDCLKVMHELGRFDAVVTDPPYGVLSEDWDRMTNRQLHAFTLKWLLFAYDRSDNLITFFGQKTREVPNTLLPLLFERVRQIIWNKKGGAQAQDGLFFSYESAYLCRKQVKDASVVKSRDMGLATELTKCRQRAGVSKGAVDIAVRGKKTGLCYRWEEGCCLPTDEQIDQIQSIVPLSELFFKELKAARAVRETNISANRQRAVDEAAGHLDILNHAPDTRNPHPSPKPVALMSDIVTISKAQTILDPFMGSGTTLVACQRLGRSGTGIELDPDYFQIACERVHEAWRSPDLFIEPPKAAPAEQLSMLDGDAA